jgi:hypothetical protein
MKWFLKIPTDSIINIPKEAVKDVRNIHV